MSRNALTLVFPAAAALLVCSLVVLFLTATGLEPGPSLAAQGSGQPEAVGGCGVMDGPAGPDSLYLASLSPAEAEAVAAGEALFQGNCAQCHAINEVVVGPALAGIAQRRPRPWLVKWVQNSSRLVASGDEYAVKIFNQYQKQQMPSFQLTAAEIGLILQFVRSQEASAGRAGAGAVAVVD